MNNLLNGMKIGVVHPQLYPQVMMGDGPVVETAAAIVAEPDIRAIEVTHVRDEVARARLKLLLTSAGMKVIFNALPVILKNGWNIDAEEASARGEALAGLKGLLEEARFLGAKLFVVMSGTDTGADGRAAAKGRLVSSLQVLADEAGRMGMSVTLMPFDREVDKKRLVGPVSEAVDIAKQVKRDNFGLSLNLAHILLNKENPGDAVSSARHYLMHAVVSNCVLAEGSPVRGDQHPCFGTEGSLAGLEQVTEFIRALEKGGFFKKAGAGWVSLEIRPREEEYSAAVLAGGLRLLVEAVEKL